MIALIIDTDTWLRVCRRAISSDFQGRTGETTLDILVRLVRSNRIQIIASTVVVEEWNKHKADLRNEYSGILKSAIGSAVRLRRFLSNDAGDMLDLLLDADRFDEERVQNVVEERIRAVEDLIEYTSTIHVSPDEEVKLRAVEVALDKKAPFNGSNSMADALILFSTMDYVEAGQYERVFFVSHNKNDFSDKKDPDRIHPDLAPLLKEKRAEYFRFLELALDEIPDSQIGDEALEEVEWERAVESLVEEAILRRQEFDAELSEALSAYRESTLKPFQEVINQLSHEQSEKMREALNQVLLSTSPLEFLLRTRALPHITPPGLYGGSVSAEEE